MKIAWFSAGITSAVAVKYALKMYKDVKIVYIEISSAHPDNDRFMSDCEEWYGQPILRVRNKKGYKDQFEVIEHTKYINGAGGARCTVELKKNARFEVEKQMKPEAQIFGFEFSEKEINRAVRFKEQYPKTNPLYPLIDKQLTKQECHAIIQAAGIDPPEMYKLGYNNNNCIGCVKGKKGYWNKIREDFPETFDRMAKLERKVGRSCIKIDTFDDNKKRTGSKLVYLDELKKGEGILNPIVPDCGLFCQVELAELISDKTKQIISGNQKI